MLLDDDDAFLLPLAHRGHWLFSYACQEWDVDPDEPGRRPGAPAQLGRRRDCLRRYSPALAACLRTAAGCSATPTAQTASRWSAPWTRLAAIVFAGAANGSGYRLAPAIGSEVVDLLDVQRTEGAFDDHQYV